MSSLDIVSIGEPMVELNQTKPGEPTYLQGFGGDTSNMAIAAARQGAKVAYYTRLGADAFGDLFMKLWAEEGIDASFVERDAKAFTGVYFVQHGEGGDVFHYLRAGSAASRMTRVPAALIERARIVQTSGISLAIAPGAVMDALHAAKAAGKRVAFDSNLRLRLWPLERAKPAIEAAAKLADYFFPSLEDAQTLSGLSDPGAILDWAHALGPANVFLKLGAQGVIASSSTRPQRLPGMSVKSVDATGAGDCFCGAALARIAAGDDVFAAARYANVAAALSTTGYGAVAPIPRAAEVLRHLKSD